MGAAKGLARARASRAAAPACHCNGAPAAKGHKYGSQQQQRQQQQQQQQQQRLLQTDSPTTPTSSKRSSGGNTVMAITLNSLATSGSGRGTQAAD